MEWTYIDSGGGVGVKGDEVGWNKEWNWSGNLGWGFGDGGGLVWLSASQALLILQLL